MPSYSILGATGSTGRQILQCLLESPENEINVYVRSKPKLETQFPGLSGYKNVHIFEGRMDDTSLIASCIKNTRAVFAVLAVDENIPGMRIAQDSAQSVIAATKEIKSQDPQSALPRIIVLSSVTIHPVLSKQAPAVLHWLIHHAFYYNYQDLELAEDMYAECKDLDVRFIQPGALTEGKKFGSRLSVVENTDMISYADLADGMIQLADDLEFKGKHVCIVVDGGVPDFPIFLPLKVLRSLVWTFVPKLYWVCRYFGLK